MPGVSTHLGQDSEYEIGQGMVGNWSEWVEERCYYGRWCQLGLTKPQSILTDSSWADSGCQAGSDRCTEKTSRDG